MLGQGYIVDVVKTVTEREVEVKGKVESYTGRHVVITTLLKRRKGAHEQVGTYSF